MDLDPGGESVEAYSDATEGLDARTGSGEWILGDLSPSVAEAALVFGKFIVGGVFEAGDEGTSS